MKRLLDARHRWRCLTSLLVALLTASHVPAQLVDPAPNAWTPSSVQHVTVYGAAGRFAGWPANHGAWSWGNEILVGFSLGYHKDLGKKGTISIAISPRHIFLLEASMEEHLEDRTSIGTGWSYCRRKSSARYRRPTASRKRMARLAGWHSFRSPRFRYDRAHAGQPRRPISILLFVRSRSKLGRTISAPECRHPGHRRSHRLSRPFQERMHSVCDSGQKQWARREALLPANG